ncbi:MAG: methyltransferase domain-containing protein [Gammaproteobacteria bacterium]|nr:methyltransferase domain-containing protein [Gammaproteobacteria bacterium]
MADKQTIDFYDEQSDAYVELVETLPQDPTLESFIAALPAGSRVLDLGCGPGHCAARMRDQGLLVDAVDASAAMVQLANEKFALGARQATFSDAFEPGHYAAVWANFSLLHAPAEQLPAVLASLFSCLQDGGLLHISMKLGEGTARDKLGRFYAYYSEDELRSHLSSAGFEVVDVQSGELMGLAGNKEPWIALLGRKA